MRFLNAVFLCCAAALCGQDFHHSTVSGGAFGGFGAGANRLADARPGVTAAYGLRFHRNVQADIGLDVIFRPVGDISGRFTFRNPDSFWLLPFGGRAILPLREDRVLLSLGGGGSYARYRTPGVLALSIVPASGWGYYGLVNGSVALDSGRRVRAGLTAKYYAVYMTPRDVPPPLNQAFRFRELRRWFVLSGELGFSF